jgi:uncharacterized iron-regulated protein
MRRDLIVALTLVVATAVLGQVQAGELDQLPLGDPERAFELTSAAVGSFYDCATSEELTAERMVEAMSRARVVLLGEEHTSMDQKLVQAEVLEGLAGKVPGLVLGMEFFERGDNDALARWSRGELDEEALLRETDWYGRGSYRFEYYRPVMDVARRLGIRVVGLNVSREIPRAVNRGGLGALSEEQRQQVGEISTDGSPQHRYLVSRYFGDTVAEMPPSWADNMYAAQCLWDVVMARAILDDLGEGETMVVVVGSGHVAYDLGIARRIREERAARGLPPLEVVTFCPATAPLPPSEGEMTGHPVGDGMGAGGAGKALFSRALADIVGVFADSGGVEAYPTLGARLEAGDPGPRLGMVWPGSRAEGAGLERGDLVLDVNGEVPADLAHLRLILSRIQWGQRLDLRVRRGEETLEVAMLLEPEVRTTVTETAPGFVVEAAGEVRPESAQPVGAAPAGAPAPPHRQLVSEEGRPVRVEVWEGKTLVEVHQLDEAGRVRRSLYRDPQADGAVEVAYARGEDGEVVGTTRRDRTGQLVSR